MAEIAIHRNITVRRCGYCREGGHIERNCIVASQFGEMLHQRVVEIRSRDIASHENSHAESLLRFFRTFTNTERRILCRKINIVTYMASLVERGKYQANELEEMDLKRKQVSVLMMYYHYDNYNPRVFANTALIQDQVYEMRRLNRFDEDVRDTIMHLLGYPFELTQSTTTTTTSLPIPILMLNENSNSNEKQENFDCPICMECKEKKEKVIFTCSHGTCYSCLKECIEHDKGKKEYNCCLCRAKIQDITFTNGEYYDAYKK